MNILESATSFGFKVVPDLLSRDEFKDSKSWNELKKLLLFSDLRKNILEPYFPSDISGSQISLHLEGPVVFQIISVINIAVPSRKKHEECFPRCLSLTLTDGHVKVTGIEIDTLSDIKSHTPPGGKILYLGGEVTRGKLILTSKNCKYLGGEVSFLLESHLANINALKFRNYSGSGSSSIASKNKAKGGILGPPKFELKLHNLEESKLITPVESGSQVIEKSNKPLPSPQISIENPNKSIKQGMVTKQITHDKEKLIGSKSSIEPQNTEKSQKKDQRKNYQSNKNNIDTDKNISKISNKNENSAQSKSDSSPSIPSSVNLNSYNEVNKQNLKSNSNISLATQLIKPDMKKNPKTKKNDPAKKNNNPKTSEPVVLQNNINIEAKGEKSDISTSEFADKNDTQPIKKIREKKKYQAKDNLQKATSEINSSLTPLLSSLVLAPVSNPDNININQSLNPTIIPTKSNRHRKPKIEKIELQTSRSEPEKPIDSLSSTPLNPVNNAQGRGQGRGERSGLRGRGKSGRGRGPERGSGSENINLNPIV